MVINCVTSHGGTLETFLSKISWVSEKCVGGHFLSHLLFEVGFWGQVASRGRYRKGFFGLCKLRDQMVNQGFTTFYHSKPLLPQK